MALLIIPDEVTSIPFTVVAAQTVFPFSFACFGKTDLHFSVNGVELLQTDFTFTGTLLSGGGYQGGVVTLNVAVAACICQLWRVIIPTRSTNFSPSPSVAVRDLDVSLNRQMAITQDCRRDIAGTLTVAANAAVAAAQAVLSANSAVASAASASAAAASAATIILSATSTTSVAVATGALAITVTTGKVIPTGAFLAVTDSVTPANYMHGTVTSYNSGTGALVMNILDIGGSGTHASWNITGSGPQGPVGATGPGTGDMLKANNLSDLVNPATARTNLGAPGTATANTFALAQTLSNGGSIAATAGTSAKEIGYGGVPQTVKGTGFTTTAAGIRGSYYCTATETATIDSNANVPIGIGDFYMFVVPAGVVLTLAITSDTLRQPAGNLTGPRTVTGPGYITVMKMLATEWWVTGGSGVS